MLRQLNDNIEDDDKLTKVMIVMMMMLQAKLHRKSVELSNSVVHRHHHNGVHAARRPDIFCSICCRRSGIWT